MSVYLINAYVAQLDKTLDLQEIGHGIEPCLNH